MGIQFDLRICLTFVRSRFGVYYNGKPIYELPFALNTISESVIQSVCSTSRKTELNPRSTVGLSAATHCAHFINAPWIANKGLCGFSVYIVLVKFNAFTARSANIH